MRRVLLCVMCLGAAGAVLADKAPEKPSDAAKIAAQKQVKAVAALKADVSKLKAACVKAEKPNKSAKR